MNAPVGRLWLAVVLGYTALGATLQLLPSYLPAHLGVDGPAVPVLVGIAFVATAVARPVAGRLVDTGAARRVVLSGAIATAAGAMLQWVAPSVVVLGIGRLVMGAGEGLLFSAALPWVLSGVSVERRGRVAGWFGLSMWSGLTVGPALAAVVGSVGADAVWALIVVAPLVSVCLVASARDQAPRPRTPRVRVPLVPPGSRLPGVFLGLSAYGYGTVIGLLAIQLSAHGLANDACLSVLAAAFLLVRAAGSPAIDRFGAARVAAVLALVEATALGLVPLVRDDMAALVVSAMVGAGIALAYPCAVAITLGRVSDAPGAAVGAMTSWWDLGILAAGLAGAALAAHSGAAAAFVAAAGAVVGAFLVVVAIGRVRPEAGVGRVGVSGERDR